MIKKQWDTPQLIVLIRSHPEETVLGTCKTQSPLSGPDLYLRVDDVDYPINCMGSSSQPDISTTPCQGASQT